MSIFGGLFGRKPYMGAQIREDANAPKLTDLLGQPTGETQQPWNTQPQALPQKPGLFGKGGKAWDVIGNTADALIQMRGGPAVYDDGSKRRLQEAILQAQIQQQQHNANYDYELAHPKPANNDTINDLNWYKTLSPEDRALYHQMKPIVQTMADGTQRLYNPVQSPVNVPPVGTIEDGHRFKGGNPADPSSWESVQASGGQGGPYNNVVDPAGEAAMISSLGRAGYEQWKRKYGLQVMGNR